MTFNFCQAMTILIEHHYTEQKELDGEAQKVGTQIESSQPERHDTITDRHEG